jgi:hypothetical protein
MVERKTKKRGSKELLLGEEEKIYLSSFPSTHLSSVHTILSLS